MENHRGSDSEQWRLDRVAIAAAVTAVFGPAACIRSITPAGRDRERAWVRQGRLGIESSHRMPPAFVRSGPAFDRGRS